MIRCLAWLYYNTRQGQYIHFNKAAPRPLVISASVGKLKHWTLIEQQPNVDDDSKNKSGYVMITNMGRAWLEKKVEVIKYRYLYNDRCVGQYGPLVGLVKYEAKKFHYTNDIMNSALWTPK